jgi:hypothetical protein
MFYAPAVHARRGRDHYSTPHELTRALVSGLKEAGIDIPSPVYDPCAGNAMLLDSLRGMGLEVRGSDLYPEEYSPREFLRREKADARDGLAIARRLGRCRSIVTNPPYGRIAQAIVKTGVDLVKTGDVEMAAFLLPLPWEAASNAERVHLLKKAAYRIVCCWRPEWIDGTGGGGKMNYVWLVWVRDHGFLRPQTIYVRRS